MPFAIQARRGKLYVFLTGVLTPEDLVGAITEFELVEASYARVPDRVCDLSGITEIALRADDIRQLVFRRLARRFPNRFRSAVVAPDDLHMGYARMFQILNDHPDIEVAIFRTPDEAERWLGA